MVDDHSQSARQTYCHLVCGKNIFGFVDVRGGILSRPSAKTQNECPSGRITDDIWQVCVLGYTHGESGFDVMVATESLMHDPESPTTSHPKAPPHGRGSWFLDSFPLGRLPDSTITLESGVGLLDPGCGLNAGDRHHLSYWQPLCESLGLFTSQSNLLHSSAFASLTCSDPCSLRSVGFSHRFRCFTHFVHTALCNGTYKVSSPTMTDGMYIHGDTSLQGIAFPFTTSRLFP